MTIKQLKALIKKRHGSISKFTARIGEDDYTFRKFCQAAQKKMTLERLGKIEEYTQLAKSTEAAPIATDITDEVRAKIKAAIDEKFKGSVADFATKHGFEPVSIWQIMDGRRKRISAGVKKVLKALKITYEQNNC